MPDISLSDIPWETIWSRDLMIASIFAIAGAAIRGITGFGANLIWAPALVVLYGPAETVAIMGITGILSAFPIFVPAMSKVDWREIGIIIASAFVLAPVGVWSLLYLEPDMFRRIMGGLVLFMAVLLMTGWRYEGTRSATPKIIAGGVSGYLAGFAGIGGPICALYFMSAPGTAQAHRANNTVSVSLLIPVPILSLGLSGRIGFDTVIKAMILVAPYMVGQWLGGLLFGVMPQQTFRRIVLWLLAAIGVGSMVF